jgi:predicted metal-dependent peptidase
MSRKETDTMLEIIKARLTMVLDHCFWGQLAMRLKLEECDTIPTGCVNGKRIKYNPTFTSSLTPGQREFFIAHEVMHCATGSHLRRNGRDKELWNKACDYAINPILIEAGFEMIDGCLLNEQYHNLTAEEIYSDLHQKEQEQEEQEQEEQEQEENSDGSDGDTDGSDSTDGTYRWYRWYRW